MKTIRIIAWALMCATLVLGASSCSRKVTASQAYGEETLEEKRPSIRMAEEKPYLRSYGDGTSFDHSTAAMEAQTVARSNFASNLGTAVYNMFNRHANGAQIAHSDAVNASIGTDYGRLSQSQIIAVAGGVVRNTAVINTDTYRKRDGQSRVFVCIEYFGDIAQLARDMAQGCVQAAQVGQQVSDEEREQMQANADRLSGEIEEYLNRLGGHTF